MGLDDRMPTSIVSMVGDRARTSADVTALIIGDDEISYGELAHGASTLAAALVAAGVEPGHRVATLVPNCREVLETLIAASAIGAIFVPLNFRYRAHELGQVLADCQPAVVLVDDDPAVHPNRAALLRSVIDDWSADGATGAGSAARDVFGIRRVVRLTSTGPEAAGADAADSFVSFVADPPASTRRWEPAMRDGALAIMYTSGTSAAPKGVLVPEAALSLRQAAIAARLGLRSGDRMYSPLPLFHIAGYIPFLSSMSVGATYVTSRYFDAATACALIARHHCRAAWTGFDTILRSILEASEAGAGSLHSVEVDALIGPPPSLQYLESRLGGARLLLIYGSTELGSAATLPAPSDDLALRTETSGFELTGTTIAVMSADGKILAPGERGEICARGPAVTAGYYSPTGEIDRTGFDADGWFHSGDLGLRRPDGRIQYVSRLKDLIKVGGENVTGAEIESFLIRHPKVAEVQVVGVPDERHGEVPVAFVQWASGAHGDARELREHCEAQLSRVRVPRDFVFLAEGEWPMSATKIRKGDLREMYLMRRSSSGGAPRGDERPERQEQRS